MTVCTPKHQVLRSSWGEPSFLLVAVSHRWCTIFLLVKPTGNPTVMPGGSQLLRLQACWMLFASRCVEFYGDNWPCCWLRVPTNVSLPKKSMSMSMSMYVDVVFQGDWIQFRRQFNSNASYKLGRPSTNLCNCQIGWQWCAWFSDLCSFSSPGVQVNSFGDEWCSRLA